MVRVERHELRVGHDCAAERDYHLNEVLFIEEQAAVPSSFLVGTLDEAELALAYASIVGEPYPPLLPRALALGGRAGAARFHAAAHGAFAASFGGPEVLVPGDGPDSTVHPVRFRQAWCLAWISGETEGLGWLRAFPLESTLGSSTTTDLRERRISAALQALQDGRPVRPVLADALEGPTHSTSPRALPVAISLVELLRSLDDDPAAFDRALVRHLEAHRGYWGVGDDRSDVLGAVALTALALVAVARSRGWRVDVESDYLPTSLLG